MKKILCFVTSMALCGLFAVNVSAADGINSEEQAIIDTLKAGVSVEGKTVTVPGEYVNAAEKYFATEGVEITADQAKVVNAQIDAAKAIIVENKVTDLTTIDKTVQDKILVNAKTAAAELGLTIEADYSAKTIVVKDKNGKVLVTAEKVIKNSGDDFTSVLVMSGLIAMVLAGAGVVASKKGYFAK